MVIDARRSRRQISLNLALSEPKLVLLESMPLASFHVACRVACLQRVKDSLRFRVQHKKRNVTSMLETAKQLAYSWTKLKAVARVTSLVSPSSPRTSWRPSLHCSLKARPLLHPRYGPCPRAPSLPGKAMCSSADTRATVRPTTSSARSSNDLKRTQPLPMSSFLPLFLYSLVNQVERVG